VSEEQFAAINEVREMSVVDEILGGAAGVAERPSLTVVAKSEPEPAKPVKAVKPEPEVEPELDFGEPAKPAKAVKPRAKPAPEPAPVETADSGVDALEKLVRDFDL
jgi:outer membrane biosynthesis protein TonB